MAKQNISVGSVANDGTGDTLRQAGNKINANFTEIYNTLGDGLSFNEVSFDSTSLVYEGALPDANETRLKAVEPTGDNNILLPDASGTVVLLDTTDTLTNKTLTTPNINSGVLTTPQINDTSSDHQYIIAVSELAADRTITLPLLTGDDTIVFNDHTQTLTNKTILQPRIQDFIFDSVGSAMLELDRQGTLSHIKISNANSPTIAAQSTNANSFLQLSGKGSAGVSVNKLFVTAFDAQIDHNNIALFDSAAYHAAGVILCNKPSALALGLDNGTSPGEMKHFINKNNGLATVEPTNFAQGTSFALRLNATAQVCWDGLNWHLTNGVDSINGTAPLAYTI